MNVNIRKVVCFALQWSLLVALIFLGFCLQNSLMTNEPERHHHSKRHNVEYVELKYFKDTEERNEKTDYRMTTTEIIEEYDDFDNFDEVTEPSIDSATEEVEDYEHLEFVQEATEAEIDSENRNESSIKDENGTVTPEENTFDEVVNIESEGEEIEEKEEVEVITNEENDVTDREDDITNDIIVTEEVNEIIETTTKNKDLEKFQPYQNQMEINEQHRQIQERKKYQLANLKSIKELKEMAKAKIDALRAEREERHSKRANRSKEEPKEVKYDAVCSLQLVETIPVALKQGGHAKKMRVEHMTIFDAWMHLMSLSKENFAIVSQWGIGKSGRGAHLFNHLKENLTRKRLKVDIVHTLKMKRHTHHHSPGDLADGSKGKVEIHVPDVVGKTSPPWKYGIIHSKLVVSDKKHFYLGSANFGSRGTTFTKELGILVKDCPTLGEDARKIFDLYRSVDGLKSLPKRYSKRLNTKINVDNPLTVYNTKDDIIYKVFIASSPRTLCAYGRSDDLQAILHVINGAKEFIYIAVNEYIPMDLWKRRRPWTVIDDSLRKAISKRKVSVKFLVNSKASHKDLMLKHLKSLKEFSPSKVSVRIYSGNVRGFHGSHTKLMVTDISGFIGTSNWTEDYYTTTAGVSFTLQPVKRIKDRSQLDLRQQMKQVFLRDFYSDLAKPLAIK